MMRLTWITVFTLLVVAPASGQQAATQQAIAQQNQLQPATSQRGQVRQAPGGVVQQGQASGQQQVRQAGSATATAGQAVQPVVANTPPPQPFQLTAEQASQLNDLLLKWQAVSETTRTLECTFQRWHYDMFAAPAGIHATKAVGIIKYAAPDKGLFRVDQLMFYKGMQGGDPQYGPQQGKFGEHWVCNGRQLIEFDRTMEQCRVQDLPPEMQGEKIFNGPLPFVFNLNAQQIQQRYWVREVNAPKQGIHLIEAWPKLQEDRAQYKLVQIALQEETFLPTALIMYAPNFNVKTAQKFDHYEFTEMKRNSIGSRFSEFLKYFIPEKPPANWEIVRSSDLLGPIQQAAGPNQPNRK